MQLVLPFHPDFPHPGNGKCWQALHLIITVNKLMLPSASKLVHNCLIESSITLLRLDGHARYFLIFFSNFKALSSAFVPHKYEQTKYQKRQLDPHPHFCLACATVAVVQYMYYLQGFH